MQWEKGDGEVVPPVWMLLLFRAPQPILLCWQLWEGLPRALEHSQQGLCALLNFLHVQRDPPEHIPAPLCTRECRDPQHQRRRAAGTSAGNST